MKKFLFLAIAAAAMTSCSQDETLDAIQGEAISFGNAYVGNVTRAATDPSYSSTNQLTAFNVWGTVTNAAEGSQPVAIFTQTNVTGTVGENSTWTPTTTQYWVEDAKYNFAALVNEGNNGNVTLTNSLPSAVKFTYSDGSVDLLYAKSEENIVGKASGQNENVQMDFNHLLSKVKFTVVNKSTAATQYSFLVKNIKVNGATEGTCALPEMTWSSLNQATGIDFSDITTTSSDSKVECENELLLIPNDVTVSFTIDIIYNGTTVTSHNYATTTKQTLTVGNAYNFLIEVSVGDPILFTVVDYPTWENGNTTDGDDDDTEFDHIPVTLTPVN